MTKAMMLCVPGALLLAVSPATAIDLRQAVQTALSTNPEIRQAVSNRYATEEERIQAQGAWYPRVSVEASAGVRSLKNPTRRAIGIADETLWPVEGAAIVDQLLWDGGKREAEIRRQAARTDGAAARVEERSQYVALNVSRAYIDYLLQERLVAIAQDNATFHERLAGDLKTGVQQGSISIADQQQAEERLQSAKAKLTQAIEDRENAATEYQTLTGMPIDSATMPPDLSGSLPGSLDAATQAARQGNPRVREAMADLQAAREETRAARGNLGPRLNLEGSARAGHDIDGFAGRTTDLLGRVVLRWLLFDGGAKEHAVREQLRRADQVHGRLFEMTRRAESDTRSAWTRLTNQGRLADELATQAKVTDDLLMSYREQFNVGRRSLLDVLDAQNTHTNVQAQAETARLAKLYAQYRLLAATNQLTQALGVATPVAAAGGQADYWRVNPIPPADLMEDSLSAPEMTAPAAASAPATAAAMPASDPAMAAADPAAAPAVAAVAAGDAGAPATPQ